MKWALKATPFFNHEFIISKLTCTTGSGSDSSSGAAEYGSTLLSWISFGSGTRSTSEHIRREQTCMVGMRMNEDSSCRVGSRVAPPPPLSPGYLVTNCNYRLAAKGTICTCGNQCTYHPDKLTISACARLVPFQDAC